MIGVRRAAEKGCPFAFWISEYGLPKFNKGAALYQQIAREVLCYVEEISFSYRIILTAVSLPLSTKMGMELVHNVNMENRYSVKDVNEGYPATSSSLEYKGQLIEIVESLQKDKKPFVDAWEYKMVLADLTLKVNGNELETLRGYPVRSEDRGLNRYYGDIAFLKVEDKKVDSEHFYILVRKPREIITMKSDRMLGMLPDENLHYTLYKLNNTAAGAIKKENFTFNERNGLQTLMMNEGMVVHSNVGYYTSAWTAYPTIFFPLLYPIGSLFLGIFLVLISLREGKEKGIKMKKNADH
ncbi:hypothetical protein [Peribacillus sp. SCS-37]|uniref:hypothetical protein n=1 Tax=Paraperibacillus esterisolvens TaxID=3115296 RepID=UPI003905D1C4